MSEMLTPEQIADAMKSTDWTQEHEAAKAASGGGSFAKFLGKGSNRLRLIIPQERLSEPRRFFEQVENWYQGTESKKFLVFALIREMGDREAKRVEGKTDDELAEMARTVYPIAIPTRVKNNLLGFLGGKDEDFYDILSPAGYAITISKTGMGQQTTYQVMPSRDKVPIDYTALIWPEKTMTEIGVDFSAYQRSKGGGAVNQTPATKQDSAPVDSSAGKSGW